MSSSNFVRVGGGLASAASGVLLLAGHILNLGGDPEYGTVPGASLVLTAHVALYAAQAEPSGLLGALGMVLSVIGTTLASAVVFVEIARASGVAVGAVLGMGVPGALAVLGGLAFLIGLILFGIATIRAGVFPWWGGLLLIVGDVVFGAGSFAGAAAPVVSVVGAAITCAGFVWLGWALLSGPRSDVSARRPLRLG